MLKTNFDHRGVWLSGAVFSLHLDIYYRCMDILKHFGNMLSIECFSSVQYKEFREVNCQHCSVKVSLLR